MYRHEKRHLKTGSGAATPERVAHPSWEAVVDNYVYIHNAFRNSLQRIISNCENQKSNNDGTDDSTDLENWRDIIDLHSRVEDELIVVAVQARLKKNGSEKTLPESLLSGKDHESVKDLLGKALNCNDNTERVEILNKLASELDRHLAAEEETMIPLLLDNFTLRELWALDSFIINPKLGYCDKETLIKIMKWWFGNLSVKEAWPLLKNFIKAGKQPPMPLEGWKKLQDDIPALQKFPTEDLVPP